MAKIKVSEVQGAALDWLVAKAQGRAIRYDPMGFGKCANGGFWVWEEPPLQMFISALVLITPPSTNWAQGGPLIQRARIQLLCNAAGTEWTASAPRGKLVGWRVLSYGPTPLIAAMRCYVVSIMGEEVEVPDELVNQEGKSNV